MKYQIMFIHYNLTLGWTLGFRQELYGENELLEGISKTEYISEASCSIDNQQYYFLGIKDFLNNNKQIMYSTFLENTKYNRRYNSESYLQV